MLYISHKLSVRELKYSANRGVSSHQMCLTTLWDVSAWKLLLVSGPLALQIRGVRGGGDADFGWCKTSHLCDCQSYSCFFVLSGTATNKACLLAILTHSCTPQTVNCKE